MFFMENYHKYLFGTKRAAEVSKVSIPGGVFQERQFKKFWNIIPIFQ